LFPIKDLPALIGDRASYLFGDACHRLLSLSKLLLDFGNAVQKSCGRNENHGHRDVKTAMHYQLPELEIVPAALDTSTDATETGCGENGLSHILRHTCKEKRKQAVDG